MKIITYFQLAFIIGWVANLIQVIMGFVSYQTVAEMTPFFIFKVVSVFIAPVGAVLGWIGFF